MLSLTLKFTRSTLFPVATQKRQTVTFYIHLQQPATSLTHLPSSSTPSPNPHFPTHTSNLNSPTTLPNPQSSTHSLTSHPPLNTYNSHPPLNTYNPHPPLNTYSPPLKPGLVPLRVSCSSFLDPLTSSVLHIVCHYTRSVNLFTPIHSPFSFFSYFSSIYALIN